MSFHFTFPAFPRERYWSTLEDRDEFASNKEGDDDGHNNICCQSERLCRKYSQVERQNRKFHACSTITVEELGRVKELSNPSVLANI